MRKSHDKHYLLVVLNRGRHSDWIAGLDWIELDFGNPKPDCGLDWIKSPQSGNFESENIFNPH